QPDGEHSAGHLAAQHIANLENEVDRLRTQLDDAKRTSAVPTQFSREREFLNLREVINRKEKEILDLREEVDAKDRVMLGGEAEGGAAVQRAADGHKAALAAREKALGDERDGQLASLRADFGDKLERARQDGVAALSAARTEAHKQAQQLASEKEAALARAER